MNIVQEIKESWGWIGVDPVGVVGENDFGNLMIKDASGSYWRLCPEDLYCKIVATNREELDRLSTNQEFLEDWYMQALVEQASKHLGPLTDDQKYCLVTSGALGGEYAISNISTAPLYELIRFSGHAAKQIKDLPDGTKIQPRVID
jgi:hypothetical protein